VQFSSEAEFHRYRANERSDSYFAAGLPRYYIVMSDLSDRAYGTAIHEYTHLAIQLSGLRVPLWVNEGWAEVNSTLRPSKTETAVGDLIPEHLRSLEQDKWLDFETLTTVDHSSPIYNEANRAGIFYAQSWALMHMLYLSPDYQSGFGKFILALSSGQTAEQACRAVWGKSGAAVFKDLKSYFDRKQLYGRAFELKFDTKTVEPSVSKVSDFDSRLVLADLLAAINRKAEAKAAYDQLNAEQPGRADVAESIGYLALSNRDLEGARAAFEKAFNEGSTNPLMCFELGGLESAAGQPLERAIAPLERAVKLKPDFADARLQLGKSLVAARRFPEAITDLLAMPDVKPERAPPLFCSLAYAYLETGDLSEARQNLDTCRKWVKQDRDIKMADSLAKLINARSSGPAIEHTGERREKVQGVIRQVDCSAAGGRMVLETQGKDGSVKPMTFFLPPAQAVELNATSGSTLLLSCGPQKPIRVTLEFAPAPEGMTAVDGAVRRIEF
jgi:tetratricopeptide (TPR) repeat protein